MKVFKFGGAAISNLDGYKNVATIIQQYTETNLLVVISAMGKTTNALEQVVQAFVNNENQKALALFNDIKTKHIELANGLLKNSYGCTTRLNDFFTEKQKAKLS